MSVSYFCLRSQAKLIYPKIMTQLEIQPRTWGGRREGAGRKRLPPGKRRVSHLARERFEKPTPAHVTMRVADRVWNLRSGRAFRRIRYCFRVALGRFGLRLIEFSVQGNHLHLIVEADDTLSLSRGMQGLSIRLAKSLNAMMKRSGRVFADHYHARLLRTPTELVRAIAYVLDNAARHYGPSADPFSSQALRIEVRLEILAEPSTWLVRTGWRRARAGPAGPFGASRTRLGAAAD